MRRAVLTTQVLLGLLAFLVFEANGQTTEFTYQGNLVNSGSAANGNFDFEFALFDALSGGNQIGSTIPKNTVAVANGIFAVQLDFGSQFPGASRYLEIRVRPSGQGALTILAPRQLINSSPYAVKSINADSATNATQLAGVAASQYVLTGDTRLTDSRNPLPGSSNYIQNSTTQQAPSDFNISGNGTAAGTFSANVVNADAQFNLAGGRILAGSSASGNIFVGATAGASNSTGTGNSYFGALAGAGNTTGNSNSAFGNGAGLNNTGGSNNAFFGAGANNSGNTTNSAAIGFRAFVTQSNSLVLGSINGVNNANSDTNVGIGTTAPTERLHVVGNILVSNQITASQFNIGTTRILGNSGFHNVYFGENAGGGATGTDNTFVGWRAGEVNTSNSNSFFGSQSGRANTIGVGNAFMGDRSGWGNTTGNLNSFFGNLAGANNTTGNSNTFLGNGSGAGNSTGSFNTLIGFNANVGLDGLTNASAVGYQSRVDVSNALVLGSVKDINGATANTTVGIGTTSPGTALDVQNSNSSVAIRARSTAGSSTIFLDRASAAAANSAQIGFYSAGNPDFAMGTSQGSAGVSDFSVYNYGSGSNAFTILKSSGNIGVGTVAPGTPLEVNRNSTMSSDWQTGQLRISGASDPNMQLNLGYDTTANLGVIQAGQAFTGFKRLILNPFGGSVVFGGTGGTATESFIVLGDSRFVISPIIGVLGTGGTTSLCLNGSGKMSSCSSSLRYKTNIANFGQGLDLIKRLRPITFDWKQGGMHDLGLGAEEVAKVEPLLVTYNKDGQVEGVKYDRIGVVLINAVKEQQAQIDKQAKTIEELQREIDALKLMIEKRPAPRARRR
jgi:hypothetical protein